MFEGRSQYLSFHDLCCSAKRACYNNQTGDQQNSPNYSTYHQGSSNLCTLPINIEDTTQPELEYQNQVHELSQNLCNEAVPLLLTNKRPRSEVNSLLENLSPDELDDPIDYTFQGASHGTQQIWTDIETQPVDYAIAYNPAFAELAPCLSAHPFDFSLPPIQSDFDDSGPNFST
ncbi:hypothetical protein PITC_006940 [Penicillium italicum]|uniref:Uncharacterized protein n=1 Tax=Penicillium italicum TaxID=40296 RepID=A0A0A2K8V9_PENIT|nr:hypothetical protein PITC_006940 [Penicillium italicum]